MSKVKSIVTVAGVAVGALAFMAPNASAFAPSSWTITPSGGAITATAPTTILTDNQGNQISCASSSASGALKTSPVAGTPATLATISSLSFNPPCNGPLSSTWTVTTDTTTPWQIHGTDYATGGTGVTTGFLDGIKAHLVGSTPIGSCTFDVTGSVDGKYNNPSAGGSNGTLVVAPAATSPRTLTIANKTGPGCSVVGTTATFKGTYTVKSGATSPTIVGNP
jgi:hypothetical protein